VRHFLEMLDELSHLGIEFVSLRENIDTGGPRLSLPEVSKRQRLFRATVCRLINESGRLRKTGVAQVRIQGSVIPLTDVSNSQVAA